MFETVARSRWPWSMRVKRSRFVFSQSCSVFWRVVSRRLRIISLSLSLSTATSPLASTLTWRVRSPSVTAVATSAIARTWSVRLAASWLTLSVRSFQTPATSSDCAWPPSLPSTPTSRATRVTSPANRLSWSTIALTVFLSSRNSPRTSAVIFLLRSPLATAVVTSAMSRTWPVRLPAIRLTLSVRSFQTPPTSIVTAAACPSLPSVPTSRATRVTSETKPLSWSTIAVDRVLELQHLALDVGGDLLAQIAVGDRADDPLHLVAGADEVLDQAVDRFDAAAPDLVGPLERDALGELALLADDAADPLELGPERLIGADELVEAVGGLAAHTRPVHGHARGEVARVDVAQNLEQHFQLEGARISCCGLCRHVPRIGRSESRTRPLRRRSGRGTWRY